jgi:hypothetical protein
MILIGKYFNTIAKKLWKHTLLVHAAAQGRLLLKK